MEKTTIEVDLLKRLITNLWYQDPGLDDVTELSKELIEEYTGWFVDVSADGEYIGTKPEWLQDDRNANLIYAPEDEDEGE